MNLFLWLLQSCLLSLAIFVLLGEELDFDRKHGDLLCERAIPVAGEQQYPYISRCCKLEKLSKWQIPFGLLAVGQTSFVLVIFSLRRRRKSPGLLLPALYVAFWVLTVILLLTKLAAHFSPDHTAANSGYIAVLCTSLWIVMTALLTVGFQRIFHIVGNLTANADKSEDLKNGVYFCSPEEDKVLRESMSANILCALIVLMVAYFVSSCHTLCLALAHSEVELTEVKDVKPKRNKGLQRCQKRGDVYESDSLVVGGEGEVQPTKKTDQEVTLTPRNCIRDFNKNTVSVGSVEESEDESFVFGWRL